MKMTETVQVRIAKQGSVICRTAKLASVALLCVLIGSVIAPAHVHAGRQPTELAMGALHCFQPVLVQFLCWF